MRSSPWLALTASALLIFAAAEASAKASLLTLSDGVIVYSGAGTFYRPIAVLPAKTEMMSSTKVVRSRDGQFYRVLVKLSEKRTAIGFIPTTAEVRYSKDDRDEDELEKYGDVALINRAVQVTFASLRDKHYMWTVGYMDYFGPGFYMKYFAGQYLAPSEGATGNMTSTVGGAEIGNDALLFNSVSGYVAYGLGVFAPASKDDIFAGSTRLNAMMQGSVGLRLNFDGFASLSAGGTQTVFFNQNNSYVTHGWMLTLEVGL